MSAKADPPQAEKMRNDGMTSKAPTLRFSFFVRSLLRAWSYAAKAALCLLPFVICLSAADAAPAEAALDQLATACFEPARLGAVLPDWLAHPGQHLE